MATGLFAGVESNFARVREKERRAASWSAAHSSNRKIAILYLSRPEASSAATVERFFLEATVIHLPTTLDYPIVAIADLHGQHD